MFANSVFGCLNLALAGSGYDLRALVRGPSEPQRGPGSTYRIGDTTYARIGTPPLWMHLHWGR